ncbi:MAG: hydroxymethylbilane synthase [Deltaproteobacteria bacterium]|nr:hydroxymethylbilane synthase [Deltaproteobacteria bacterium]
MMPACVRIGTRGSKLALWQANWVKSAIEAGHPSLEVEITVIKTRGDKILDVPLAKIGGKGLFVKEIEEALLARRIDMAVHSMKDMPADLPGGLCVGAIPARETPHDVLIAKDGRRLSELKKGSRIGTSSLRRAAQLLFARPDLSITPLRGNLDTRLRKLEAGEMDAIVLAAAGMKRMGMAGKISEYLDASVMLPAAGQGALCIETREDDEMIGRIAAELDHRETRMAVTGERAFLHRMGGSCQVPIAAYGKISGDRYCLTGLVAQIDGSECLREEGEGPVAETERIGITLAERLVEMGAERILKQLQQDQV